MDLDEYEQRIGKSRHIEVKIKCEWCGIEKWAKWSRVKVGQGRFCSIACQGKQRNSNKQYVGKENGKVVFDKTKNSYYVYWFDPDTLQRKTTSYAHWFWEVYVEEIPDGYRASYGDGNTLNLDPDNIILISPEEFGKAVSERLMGHGFSDETIQKMSDAKKGKSLSEEHKKKIGKRTKEMWENGDFETIHVGEYNKRWKGGKREYPREFSRGLRLKIKRRDGFCCRSCNINVYGSKSGHVHHKDGNKDNCSDDNLILLCATCHNAVHGRSNVTNDKIEELKSLLTKSVL